jgi:hypothetical protein
MGHKRLGRLPRSVKWTAVVDLLAAGADVEAVARASAAAAENSLRTAASDDTFARAFWLLTQIPQAARDPSFTNRLWELGLTTSPEPGILELVGAFTAAVDTHAAGNRSDLGEMAQLAAAETLAAAAGHGIPAIFGATHEEVRRSLARYGSSDWFSVLARDFFSRLTARSLEYFLSRELSNHVGPKRRFVSGNEASTFKEALDLHCRQASRIIKEFASGWLGKRLGRGQPITVKDAERFAHTAFRKLTDELRVGRDAD